MSSFATRATHADGVRAHAATPVAHWLDSDPHVPLAAVDARGIRPPERGACRDWMTVGSRWKTVDVWGIPVGEAEIASVSFYDVTRCNEPELTLKKGAAGGGLYVSSASAWRGPARSAEWNAPAAARAELKGLVATSDRLFRPRHTFEGDPPLAPFERRALFFQSPPSAFAQSATGPNAGAHWAIVCGRTLEVFEHDERAGWFVSYVETPDALSPNTAFRVVAVFDMDGDSYPEIVVHVTDGPSWNDVVLRMKKDNWPRSWECVTTSIGGSTA